MKTNLLAKALSIFVLAISLSLQGLCDEAKSTPKQPSSDAVFVIYTKGASEAMGGGVVVTATASEEFFGMRCIVGRGVTGYLKDVKVRIPVESIVMFMEYKNQKEWEDSVRDFRGSKQR